MKIGFYGAAGTVTGSNYLLETENGKIIVDCGMFQGGRELRDRNKSNFNYNPLEIDAVIITHGHIDHIGLLPKLVNRGFRGIIYTTVSTHELMEILLSDSASIQKSDADWENKKRNRKGDEPIAPLYTQEDVINTLKLVKDVEYHEKFNPVENIQAIFKDAGHILGSGFLEMRVKENGVEKTIVFSGDLGRSNQKIIKDPETSKYADIILVESTYGDRLHKTPTDTENELSGILTEVWRTKGTLLIPAFALGRTQEMIYKFFELFDRHKIADIKIYVDSPMAVKVTEVYEKNKDLYDEESLEYLKNGKNPLLFKELVFCETKEESMRLNDTPGPKVIISSSGMCDAGRILHHLKHNLWQKNTHVLFVGFQGEGTLGRQLIEGARNVKVLGEVIRVNAKIHTVGGLSAHADRDELIKWLGQFSGCKPQVFIVHGEPEAEKSFSETIAGKLGFDTMIPDWKEVVNFPFTGKNVIIEKTPVKKEIFEEKKRDEYDRWKDAVYLVENKLIKIDKSGVKDKDDEREKILEKINRFIEETVK